MAELCSAGLFSYSGTPRSFKEWSPCGCFTARARTQVGFFVFFSYRQALCGHRIASKMKHVAAEIPQRSKLLVRARS
jgi:hypothetical protein